MILKGSGLNRSFNTFYSMLFSIHSLSRFKIRLTSTHILVHFIIIICKILHFGNICSFIINACLPNFLRKKIIHEVYKKSIFKNYIDNFFNMTYCTKSNKDVDFFRALTCGSHLKELHFMELPIKLNFNWSDNIL